MAEAGEPRFVVGPKRAGVEPVARHMTRTDWRNDDTGLVGRRSHLWVVEAQRGAAPRQLTSGDFDVSGPAWSPDGRWIAFEADREPDWNIRYRYRIFRVSPEGGPVRELVSLRGDAHGAAYSPDGRHLAFIGSDVVDPTVSASPTGCGSAPRAAETSDACRADLDRAIGAWAWADLAMAEDTATPELGRTTTTCVAVVGSEGRVLPYRFSLDGTRARTDGGPDRAGGRQHGPGRPAAGWRSARAWTGGAQTCSRSRPGGSGA